MGTSVNHPHTSLSSRTFPGNTTALVYAGGLARRMGGANKAFVPVFGKPMIEHVVERLRAIGVARIVVSANRDAERFEALGVTVLPDLRKDFPGALAALEALAQSELEPTERVFTCPCDAPFFPETLPLELDEAARRAGASGAFPRDAQGRAQSAFALFSWSVLSDAGAFLDEGGHRLGEFLRCSGLTELPYEGDERRLANLNSLEAVRAAEADPAFDLWMRP